MEIRYQFPYKEVQRRLVPIGTSSPSNQALTYCGSVGEPIIIIVHGGIIIIYHHIGPFPSPDPENPIFFGAIDGLTITNGTFNVDVVSQIEKIFTLQNVPASYLKEIRKLAK